MPDRSLDSLSSQFYPRACELIARIVGRGVMVAIVQTSRTQAEHRENLLNGTSSTQLSSHLPRRMRWREGHTGVWELTPADEDKSDAMDLAPYDVWMASGPDKISWDASNFAWGVIGEEAEKLGLRWGGRWKRPFDPGHVELVLPWKEALTLEERGRPWPLFRSRGSAAVDVGRNAIDGP